MYLYISLGILYYKSIYLSIGTFNLQKGTFRTKITYKKVHLTYKKVHLDIAKHHFMGLPRPLTTSTTFNIQLNKEKFYRICFVLMIDF